MQFPRFRSCTQLRCASGSPHGSLPRMSGRRSAFTLVELLVVMAVTLILIATLAQAFALVGDAVAGGRAAIEIAGNLRAVANRLQEDLDGATAPARPWLDEGAGSGYLEIKDGLATDKDYNGDGIYDTDPLVSNTTFGDCDDVMAFTSHSRGAPFIGERSGVAIESTKAEVIWWCQYDDIDENGIWNIDEEKLVLYRRALLILPELGIVFERVGSGNAYTNDQAGMLALKNELRAFYNQNDISVRLEWWTDGNGINVRLTANSLADLTLRENRFAHKTILSDRSPGGGPPLNLPPNTSPDPPYDALPAPGFPFHLDVNRRSITSLYRMPKFDLNVGEDVMLSDVLAMDVQVFDPTVPLLPSANAGEALVPSDPGYFPSGQVGQDWEANNSIAVGYGGFVDLGWGTRLATHVAANDWSLPFSGLPESKSKFPQPVFNPAIPDYTYCTWPIYFERNGVDEDGFYGIDQGTNGFDDNFALGGPSSKGVDDADERETSPPYAVPLRGVQIKIRAWDPDSRQLRQATIVADLIPE